MNFSQLSLYLIGLLVLVGLYLIRYFTFGYSFQEGQVVRVTGRLLEDPVIYDGRQKLNLGQVVAYVDQFPEYHYPDELVVVGEVAKGRRGWYLKNAQVSEVSEVSQVFIGIREKILETYKETLPEPQSGLLLGIILGTKNSLSLEFLDSLRKTGTLHIVVASGGNIAIFAGTLLKILAYPLSRRRAVIAVIVAIWVYVFIVGWQPPIVRAAIMGSIAFAAQALGREAFAWRALFVSAAVLLLLNPYWLWDVGFQLSFAATAGILAFSNFFARRGLANLKYIPQVVKDSFATTLSAQVAVSPILLFTFGQPLKTWVISPFANVLVLWTIPFIMASGAVMAALALVWEPLAQVVAYFIWLPLTYFVKVVEVLGSV